MLKRHCLISFVFVIAGLHSAPVSADDGWKPVYELTSQGIWLSAVRAEQGQDWTAAGDDVLVFGFADKPEETHLGDLAIMSFGTGPVGSRFASGSNGTIWQRHGPKDWRVVNQTRAAGKRGIVVDQDLLVWIQMVADASGQVLVAYGMRDVAFVLTDSGWLRADKRRARALINEAIKPAGLKLPKNCHFRQWSAYDRDGGLLACQDHRAFSLVNGEFKPLGNFPNRCDVLGSSALLGDKTFCACGENLQLWQWSQSKWSPIKGVRSVRALSANESCVTAVTERTVWQYCSPPEQTTNLSSDVKPEDYGQQRES